MLYLDKILTQLAHPLGTALALLVLALLLLMIRRRGLAMLSLLIGLGWLSFWSLPEVSDRLRLTLEGRFQQQAVEMLPQADAIVLLGGGIGTGAPDWPYPDLNSAADRIWQAARLYHAGKAPLVLISGGNQAWLGERASNAGATGLFLRDLGVPEAALLLEDQSRNTRENALFSAEMLAERGLHRILLATSALHMPRAQATFEAVGLEVIPAPSDFEVKPEPEHPLRWLPDAEALADSTRALKEYLGLLVYRLRGWAS